MIRDRVIWALFRRLILKSKRQDFSAHWSSYVDGECAFEGCNNVAKNASLYKSRLGRFTYVSANSIIINSTIGRFCSIGENTKIGGFRKHPINRKSTHPCFYSHLSPGGYSFAERQMFDDAARTITIGSDVWVGAGSSIMDGIHISHGAIIAANSTVTRDVPPYAIVGGVPASIIRYRFDTKKIAELLMEAWWDLPPEVLKADLASFQCELN